MTATVTSLWILTCTVCEPSRLMGSSSSTRRLSIVIPLAARPSATSAAVTEP